MKDRRAQARAFIAKAVWDLPTTGGLINRLKVDAALRRLGLQRVGAVPSESTFPRAFAEFSEAGIAERIHGKLVEDALDGKPGGHISKDPPATGAREREAPKPKRGPRRPRRGGEATKEPGRLERQSGCMGLREMPAGLPKACDHGGGGMRRAS